MATYRLINKGNAIPGYFGEEIEKYAHENSSPKHVSEVILSRRRSRTDMLLDYW